MANYKIYGTNQPYSGRVLNVGNKLFTTVGGALEGNSFEIVEIAGGGGNSNPNEDLPTMNNMNQMGTVPGIPSPAPTPIGSDASPLVGTGTAGPNPVIRTFFAPRTPRYTLPDGTLVAVGAPLHEHQDGTIMTEHSMGPNDNSVIVFEVTTENEEGGLNGGMNGDTPPPDITPPPGNGGGNGMNQGGGGNYGG